MRPYLGGGVVIAIASECPSEAGVHRAHREQGMGPTTGGSLGDHGPGRLVLSFFHQDEPVKS